MKIALIDLNHTTLGIHTNTVPLGCGLIANYLKKNVKQSIDVKIFKDIHKFLLTLQAWCPDVIGLAQYAWNSELNLFAANEMKKKNPRCVVLVGGPNLDLSESRRTKYLKENPIIDVCVKYDGEIPVFEIVQRLLNGESIASIKKDPSPGTYSLGNSGSLVESNELAPRLGALDCFGSIYADGAFDELLDDGYHPFLQTHRGCPFSCTYCHTGVGYYSKMLFQKTEYFKKDIEYLAKRYAHKHNVVLYLANTNFGLFNEDFEIAHCIREMQDRYDWPKVINVNSGKDPDKLLKLVSILKYQFTPAIALQTLTMPVLQNIKRKNIPFEKFVSFQHEVTSKIDANTVTELILSLPGETKESFLETIVKVLNSGVQNIVIYTLMALKGTDLASEETSKDFGHVIKYRIVPRCFSEINGIKIFEDEAVVVGTKSLPYEDYLDLRGLSFVITAFASSLELSPLRKVLALAKIDLSEWIFKIHSNIKKHSALYLIYKSFLNETNAELFSSREELVRFFGNKEHYEQLLNGQYGDNLLRKYKTILLAQHYKSCLDLAFSELYDLMKQSQNKLPQDFLKDLKIYLDRRDVGSIFQTGTADRLNDVTLNYDIPAWLSSESSNQIPSAQKYEYSVFFSDYTKNRLSDLKKLNNDIGLSVQMLYRDGTIKAFWPQWVRKS